MKQATQSYTVYYFFFLTGRFGGGMKITEGVNVIKTRYMLYGHVVIKPASLYG